MTPVLVDSTVLIDLATDAADSGPWALRALSAVGQAARLVINPLIYSELSLAHRRIEALEALLPEDIFHREPLPWPAGFLAGKAFLAYRRRGGAQVSPSPAFHIGAHAAIRGYRLLTRDREPYATCFPRLELILSQDWK